MASAATSVNMCAASDSSARLLSITPPMTSASMKPPVSINAYRNAFSLPAAGKA